MLSILRTSSAYKASLALATLLCGFWDVTAQDQFMPPDRPPPADYDIQGEYVGQITGGSKLGAWLISRGSMRFDVVLLPGGLLEIPNDSTNSGGWNKTNRFNSNNVTLSGTTFSATLAGGYVVQSITGSGPNRILNGTFNGQAFALNRVMRKSPTLGLRPDGKAWAANAVSWFHESTATADLTKWRNRDNAPTLKYGNFLLRGSQSAGTISTTYLHIEYRSPFVPAGTGQNRGNSGIYLRGMHEMQVLDSFGLTGAQNEAGSIYNTRAPLVNAALPPLTWHTYDIWYTAGAGTQGTFTVYLNGVLVQDNSTVNVVTEAGFQGTTLYLQNHGNEVIYNNIWVIPNATTATLPWTTVVPPPPVSLLNRNPSLNKTQVKGYFNGLENAVDILGRKQATSVKNTRLSILPVH